MSATITQLNAHKIDAERLLAASIEILKLENRIDLLSNTLSDAFVAMETIAASLESPPMPMPKAAESIRSTIVMLKRHKVQAETFGEAS